MSLILKGIDMPKEGRLKIEITSDGLVWIDKGREFYAHKDYAIQIPKPHGRLIDADEFTDVCEILADKGGDIRPWEQAEWIAKDMPTILEAEGGDNE